MGGDVRLHIPPGGTNERRPTDSRDEAAAGEMAHQRPDEAGDRACCCTQYAVVRSSNYYLLVVTTAEADSRGVALSAGLKISVL